MKRLAVLLRGISFYNGAGKVCYSERSVDYEECLESFRVHILKPLSNVFDQIDFFIATYYSDKTIHLIKELKPRNVILYPKSQITKNQKIITPFLVRDVMDLVNPVLNEYDNILLTRFDLYYYRNIELDKLDFEKFNFAAKACVTGAEGLCDDSFWLFHVRFADNINKYVSNALNKCINNCHELNRHIDPNSTRYISKDIYVGCMVDFYFFGRLLPFWDRDRQLIDCPRDGVINFL